MLINVKMSSIVDILTFISMTDTTSESLGTAHYLSVRGPAKNRGTCRCFRNCFARPVRLHKIVSELACMSRLLAHLSRRLIGELIVCQSLWRPSVVRPSVNIFKHLIPKTTGPIELKFHMDTGTKVCSNGPGHMTKMAATPIYGKNSLKIFFSRARRPMTLRLGM